MLARSLTATAFLIAALALTLTGCSSSLSSPPVGTPEPGGMPGTSEASVEFTVAPSGEVTDAFTGTPEATFIDARKVTFTLGGSGSAACAPSVESVELLGDVVQLHLKPLPTDVMCTMDFRGYGFELTAAEDVFTSETKLQTALAGAVEDLPWKQ